MLRFRHISILTALLFLALAALWMCVPAAILTGWGVEFSDSTGLVSRRAAALYAGIGVMFLAARNAEPSQGRTSLVAGMVTTCLMLAALGVFEWVTGHASPGILIAVSVEVIWALAVIVVSRSERTGGERGTLIRMTRSNGLQPAHVAKKL